MASPKAPQLIYGCGGLGHEISADSAAELLQALQAAGVTRLDTAALYPPTDIGASQRLIGQTGASAEFTVDTKVMVSITGLAGTLEPAKIEQSAAQSVQDLGFGGGGKGKINVFYAHAPDVATPLQDQAAAFDAQYKKGLFSKVR